MSRKSQEGGHVLFVESLVRVSSPLLHPVFSRRMCIRVEAKFRPPLYMCFSVRACVCVRGARLFLSAGIPCMCPCVTYSGRPVTMCSSYNKTKKETHPRLRRLFSFYALGLVGWTMSSHRAAKLNGWRSDFRNARVGCSPQRFCSVV